MRRPNPILQLHLWLTLLFLYVPILVLVVLSFNEAGSPLIWGGFSTQWYAKLFADKSVLKPLINTVVIGLVTAAISTAIGTMLAMAVHRMRQRPALDGVLTMPMVIPDIVLAVALLSFFSLAQVGLGLHSVIVSHVVFCIAFVTAVMRARLDGFDNSLIEASTDLGASRLTTFRRVTLPLIAPGVVAGLLLSFTLSFDEYMIASFTAGSSSKSQTLPMYIFTKLKFGVKPDINALATLTLVISFCLVVIAQKFNKEAVDGK